MTSDVFFSETGVLNKSYELRLRLGTKLIPTVCA